MDIKEVLKNKGFVSKDKNSNRWFCWIWFLGLNQKGTRLLITRKKKDWETSGKVGVIYQGLLPTDEDKLEELFNLLEINKLMLKFKQQNDDYEQNYRDRGKNNLTD